jgi:hypothetical protein
MIYIRANLQNRIRVKPDFLAEALRPNSLHESRIHRISYLRMRLLGRRTPAARPRQHNIFWLQWKAALDATYLFLCGILWAAGEESAKSELIRALGSSDPETRILASIMLLTAQDRSNPNGGMVN